jgi:hypothetical protein
MTLRAECPRCPSEVESLSDAGTDRWVCPLHGDITPLWRPEVAEYDALVQHLDRAGSLPSWVPWPLPPGWTLQDFGVVGGNADRATATATLVSCGGMSVTDGAVSLTVVTEEPGTGLGARVAGVVHEDPGVHTQGRPVQTRARISGSTVPLWLISTSGDAAGGAQVDEPWDRAVLVGEAQGRWLWLVVSPASAALGLGDWGPLEDLGERGPELVALPFGPHSAGW